MVSNTYTLYTILSHLGKNYSFNLISYIILIHIKSRHYLLLIFISKIDIRIVLRVQSSDGKCNILRLRNRVKI